MGAPRTEPKDGEGRNCMNALESSLHPNYPNTFHAYCSDHEGFLPSESEYRRQRTVRLSNLDD